MKLMRLPDVMRDTVLGRSSIYKQISEGNFPRPVNLGGRSVAWVSDEVSSWVAERIAQRDQKASS